MVSRLASRSLALLVPALLAGTPALAGTASATSTVSIVKPTSLTRVADLNFGTMLTPATGTGTIAVNPNTGTPTYGGGLTALAGTVGQAQFSGRASRLSLVWITLPAAPVTLTRSGGTETLVANNFTIDSAGQLRLVGTTPFPIGIGATLTVPATAVGGVYSGSFALTVDYY
ncbi:DUF4402 domain-containing protein [Sphingomonas sp. ASV193]|uniref:DUF4402 domain-containing protein n=1 Tax=Sphingomonas sp. ASV193 TaxID=3144405 RepID=UPI0032E857CD